MKIFVLALIAALYLLVPAASGENDGQYYQGEIIAEGKKPAWSPDGRFFSFAHENSLIIYNMEKESQQEALELKIAEHHWINADSLLAVAWPENVTAREEIMKIVTYWIITSEGDKDLFAADSSMTSGIPSFHRPFRLPDNKLAIRKSSGWDTGGFASTDEFVVFAQENIDAQGLLDNYRYLSASNREGGSIHVKDFRETVHKTIALGKPVSNEKLSPNYEYIYAIVDDSARILDYDGKQLVNLAQNIDTLMAANFKKILGAVWGPLSKGVLYYEIYEPPEDYYLINYFDLETMQKYAITRADYYGRENIFLSPDRMHVLAHVNREGKNYIVLSELNLNKIRE